MIVFVPSSISMEIKVESLNFGINIKQTEPFHNELLTNLLFIEPCYFEPIILFGISNIINPILNFLSNYCKN